MNYYICALIVTIVSFLIFFHWKHSAIKGKEFLYPFLLLALPLSSIVNIFIKAPLYSHLDRILGITEDVTQWPIWYYPIALIVGAGAEEMIKILPLLLMMKFISLEKADIYSVGMLLGVGFGIGEAWYLGYGFIQKMPKYSLGFKNFFLLLCGFGGERLLCVFFHMFFTSIVAFGILLKRPIRYFLLAVLFHAITNIEALLYQAKKIESNIPSILTVVIFCFLLFYLFKINAEVRIKWEKPTLFQEIDKILYERKE